MTIGKHVESPTLIRTLLLYRIRNIDSCMQLLVVRVYRTLSVHTRLARGSYTRIPPRGGAGGRTGRVVAVRTQAYRVGAGLPYSRSGRLPYR